ncbi:MAG TPA: VWA domain-containing protein [Jatrophihabitantaceae bacterium]|nr:VWA domain-containing protein [Jatrophihabitantaceae bacterium]
MRFAAPGWLLLLIPAAALLAGYVIVQLRRKRHVARFTNVELLASIAPRRPGWRRHLTFALLFVALALLTLGSAQPTSAVRIPRDRATVMIALDVSLSMEATDVLPSRIGAAKQGAIRFVGLLPPRINVGLVKFGGNASVVVPPTIDRDPVKVAINNLQLQDSTAIGEAVFTCLDAISTFAKASTVPGDKPPPARIVLMSDGANNKGRTPEQAAAAAKAAGVPVSTIAFGTLNGTVNLPGYGPQPVPADRPTLRELAEATGGSYHDAPSSEALQSAYRDIGQQVGYTTTRHIVSWRFLVAGLLFTLAAGATSLLWAGRIT